MKAKWIILLLMLIGSRYPTWAQASFRLGVTAGLNGNLLHVTAFTNPNAKSIGLWRYNAGITLEHRLSPTFTLASDLLYSQQGGIESIHGPIASDQIITKVAYASLPLQLRYQPGGGRIFVSGGGQLSYLLAAKRYYASEPDQVISDLYGLHRLDVGLTVGLGYRLGRHFMMVTRYFYGLRPLNAPSPQTGEYYDGFKEYSRSWSSNLVYYF